MHTGMSFSEVRAYQYGDDVRNMDWNVTARSGETHIKTYEEERERTMYLLIDMSRSAFFGSNRLKNEVITEIAAILAFSAINNNDKVGVIFFSDKIEKFIPPKKGRAHILLIIRELLNFEPEGKGTNVSVGLQYLNNILKKRSTTFLISDFMAKGYDNALRIASKRHDIVGIHIADPAEEQLPNAGLFRALDAETGERIWLDTSDKSTRKRYADWYKENMQYYKSTFLKSGADSMSIRTTESYVNALLKFFKQRGK